MCMDESTGGQPMNLLIVDDEPDVIDGILSGVDLKKIGYTGIFTARSGEEAAEIMFNVTIDVLITDIEMSDMNGLSLLEWAQAHNQNVVTIFCTAYSDFNYAKKALELKAFDYYLKPIRYQELTDKLTAAAAEVKRRTEEKKHQDCGKYWLDFQKENRRDYWLRVFYRFSDRRRSNISGEENFDAEKAAAQMKRQADQRRLSYGKDDLFTFVVFDLYREDKLKDWNAELLDIAFENVISELFVFPETTVESLAASPPGSYHLILRQTDNHPIDRKKMIEACRAFIDFCNQHMEISADCYYCTDIRFEFCAEMIEKAFDIFRDDVSSSNQLYDIFPYRKKDAVYANPAHAERYERMLEAGQWEEVIQDQENLLHKAADEGLLTRSGLLSGQLDFMQVINKFLSSKGIPAHALQFGDDYRRLYESATDTVDAMVRFVSYVVYQAMQAVNNTEKPTEQKAPRSVVDIVRDYINAHLSEELNRASLSKTVFMNPDYLAKLFKEKNGQSLAAYIKDRRIERAKELLTETDKPISLIAQEVGYDNLSYFSSVFHDRTGLQPGEFRRQTRKE